MKNRIKKLVPLLLILVLILGTTSQAMAIPIIKPNPQIKLDITDKFTDANFLAEVRKALGKTPIEKIYNTDVLSVIELTMSSKGISDLGGIEYFANLETLWCPGNSLSSLDVSKNTNLNKLNCFGNKLTTLDVSKNTNLKELDCQGNKLTTLDVSKNTNLKKLNCLSNSLTALDVSKNTNLNILLCSSNQLISLDVSKNSKLEGLDCSSNKITALNVTKNPNLDVLKCFHNELTALDVSKNPELTMLEFTFNQLTSLDVSKNTKLAYLDCSYNHFPSKNAIIGLNTTITTYFEFVPQSPFPSAPQNINAKPDDGKVELSWAMPAYGGGSTITGFEASNNNGNSWVSTGIETRYVFTNLNNGQSYVFKVRAINSKGKGLEAEIKATPGTSTPPPLFQFGEASSWAIPELDKAVAADLIPYILSGKDMRKSISREEFAELAVRLYEKSTGKTILVTKPNPFTDTTNPQILKAYQMGITAGTSTTKFSPDTLITREQCAAMLFRAIGVIDPGANYSIKGIPDFPDQKYISDYAIEATKYMSKLGIILGNTSGEFMPKPLTAAHKLSGYGMASREAAVLMTIRTFEKI